MKGGCAASESGDGYTGLSVPTPAFSEDSGTQAQAEEAATERSRHRPRVVKRLPHESRD